MKKDLVTDLGLGVRFFFCFVVPQKKGAKACLMSEQGWGMVFTKGIRIYF